MGLSIYSVMTDPPIMEKFLKKKAWQGRRRQNPLASYHLRSIDAEIVAGNCLKLILTCYDTSCRAYGRATFSSCIVYFNFK